MDDTQPTLVASKEELDFRQHIITLACQARDDRDTSHTELDEMTYVEYYENNRKRDLSHRKPKVNKNDIRVTTGTTREKDTTLLSTLLNMNLKPDVTAFDQDEMLISELGDNMSDAIEKSRQLEDWDKKRPIIYREMVAQGDVFMQELWEEHFRPVSLSKIDWDPAEDDITSFEAKERVKKVFAGCMTRMIRGPHIYLGNIRIEYIEDQDAVFVYFLHNRSAMERKYSRWARWNYVPKGNASLIPPTDSSLYSQWNLTTCNNESVEEMFVYLPNENRFNITLNGVLMLPHNYPLDAISPTGSLPLAQGKLEPISNFAYSKSQPSKTRVDQAIIDEMTKLFVRKTRQSAEPPKGSAGKKVYSKAIFEPGKITSDMRPNQLFDLLTNPGITPSEFSFYSIVKESLNEKSVNDVYSGASQKGVDTLGQSQQMIDQQMLKLGHALDGVVNLERRLSWNRLYNIITNWTKPVDHTIDDTKQNLKELYRTFSIKTNLREGERGVKVFRFTKDEYPEVGDQEEEEAELENKYGMPVAIVYMDPEELRTLKALWYIVINPTPKTQDKLSQLVFMRNVREGYELFGAESFNIDYLKQRYSVLINENYNKLFKNMDMQQMLAMAQAGEVKEKEKIAPSRKKPRQPQAKIVM